MLCNASPAMLNADETLSALRFAERAKRIENVATINRVRPRCPHRTRLLSAFLLGPHSEWRLNATRATYVRRTRRRRAQPRCTRRTRSFVRRWRASKRTSRSWSGGTGDAPRAANTELGVGLSAGWRVRVGRLRVQLVLLRGRLQVLNKNGFRPPFGRVVCGLWTPQIFSPPAWTPPHRIFPPGLSDTTQLKFQQRGLTHTLATAVTSVQTGDSSFDGSDTRKDREHPNCSEQY